MRSFRIIGAGFSGLTLAYYLKKNSPESSIVIVDKNNDVGGLLQSEKTSFGVVEKAANALLDGEDLRAMAADIGVDLLEAAPGIKRGYILRKGRFRAWPLTILETIYFVIKLFIALLNKPNLFLHPKTTVQQWASFHLGKKAALYLLDPAMGGIYAASLDELNARLILKRFFSSSKKTDNKKKKKILSVAPRGGMNELAQKLRIWLEQNGVRFELSHKEELNEQCKDFTVFCGSLAQAQDFLKSYHRFNDFFDLSMLPVSTTTSFYDRALGYRAFGILYPRCEQRAFLGTLLNDQLFPSRYTKASETWIRAKVASEKETLDEIARERQSLFKNTEKALKSVVTFWPEALPLYDYKLEAFLRETWPRMKEELKGARIYVHGNYLGKLGLSQLQIASKELAQELAGA